MNASKSLGLWILLATLSAPVALQAQTPTAAEMDAKQARLNEQMNRLDEIERAFGIFVNLRDQKVSGPGGSQARLQAWYSKTNSWLNNWASIVAAIKDESLANPYNLEATKNQVSEQYTKLLEIQDELNQCEAQVNDLKKILAGIPVFPADYITGYEAQVSAFNQQIAALGTNLTESMKLARSGHIEKMQGIAERLKQAVSVKAAILVLRFPELESKLREVELALTAVVTVDRYTNEAARLDDKVAKAFSDGRVYAAQALLQDLVRLGEKHSASITSDTSIPPQVKKLGLSQLDAIISTRQEVTASLLRASSAAERFQTYYEKEVGTGTGSGLLARCSAARPPQNLDCLLLKTILVQPDKLHLLTDSQRGIMEKTLDRVKEGPLHAL